MTISTHQLAAILRVHPNVVRRMARDGQLSHTKNRCSFLRFDTQQVQAELNRQCNARMEAQ